MEIPKKSLNDFIETPQERTSRVRKQLRREIRKEKKQTMSAERRHFLFINPGSEKIKLLRYALKNNSPLPKFCEQGSFARGFALKGTRVTFEGLDVIDDEQKRKLVKASYFDPRKPSTIESIFLFYREKFANMSKRNVRDILKSLEVYQLNSARRRPPKVLGKMVMRAPGIIAADIFFPR